MHVQWSCPSDQVCYVQFGSIHFLTQQFWSPYVHLGFQCVLMYTVCSVCVLCRADVCMYWFSTRHNTSMDHQLHD